MKINKKKIIIIAAIVFVIAVTIVGMIMYFFNPVSSKYEEHNIVIPTGSSFTEIANILKEEKIIKNTTAFKIYLKIRKVDNIYAAAYYLSPSMDMDEIVETLLKGGHNESEITITFKEGLHMRKVAEIISEKTNNTYDSVMNKAADMEYINKLIEKYWFLTDEITNSSIYYPLEGYLFPNTYRISSKDATVEEIFEVMLDEMEDVLNNYKKDIEASNYTVHELLTMASVVELEGIDKKSRKDIAGVFYNRLNSGMSLGSDVTTYYAAKVDVSERDLYMSEIDSSNPYNTRGPGMIGKLPIGPISSVSKESIEAAIYPNTNDYLFFVADKNNDVYFTKTSSEHQEMIDKLINEGLWYEW